MKNRLAEIRRLRGLSQTQLAKTVGTSNVQISRLESEYPAGRQINEEWAVRLAGALKVQPGDLFPIITDGSVPLPSSFSSQEKSTLLATLKVFLQLHTEHGEDECERLAMAAIKLFQMALDGRKDLPFFDLDEIAKNLRM